MFNIGDRVVVKDYADLVPVRGHRRSKKHVGKHAVIVSLPSRVKRGEIPEYGLKFDDDRKYTYGLFPEVWLLPEEPEQKQPPHYEIVFTEYKEWIHGTMYYVEGDERRAIARHAYSQSVFSLIKKFYSENGGI